MAVMEFTRAEPLESELRQRIASSRQAVSGVIIVGEQDRETGF
jgi:hypothetical protein